MENILDEYDMISNLTASAEGSIQSQSNAPTQTELDYIEGILTLAQLDYSDHPNFLNLDAKDVYQFLTSKGVSFYDWNSSI